MVRVDDILNFEILKGKARLVAGHANRMNPVQSVNVMDAPDIVTWVKQNELILTTGYPIRTDRPFVENLIVGFKEKGCAALGIKIKRFFECVPEIIIEVADRVGLPVIEMPYEVTFSQVISEIMERNISAGDTSNSIKDLIDEGLEAQNLDNVIQLLSQILARPVTLESHYLETPIAFHSGRPDAALSAYMRALDLRTIDALTPDALTPDALTPDALSTEAPAVETPAAEAASFTAHLAVAAAFDGNDADAAMPEVRTHYPDSLDSEDLYRKKSYVLEAEPNDLGLTSRTIVPVRYRNEVIGKISVWNRGRDSLIEDWNRAIDYGLSLIVFLLKEKRSQTISAKKVKARIIQDLIRFDPADQERIAKLADFAGIILRGPFQVITLSAPNRDERSANAEAGDFDVTVFRLDRLLGRQLRQEPLVSHYEGRIVLILYYLVDDKNDMVNRLSELVRRNEMVSALVHDFTIGISDVCMNPGQINRAYHETLIAIAFAREKRRQIMRYTQLGLVGPFLKPDRGMGLTDLIDSTIRPIIDAANREAVEDEGKLMVTLHAYFRNNENLAETAKELFLHRNTLKYRLDMVERLTGLSLDRTEDKFKLFLGVKAYEILRMAPGDA